LKIKFAVSFKASWRLKQAFKAEAALQSSDFQATQAGPSSHALLRRVSAAAIVFVGAAGAAMGSGGVG
jgi:hypothetical protein